MGSSSFRTERANAFIQQELTLVLGRDVQDPRVDKLTITEVSLTPDRRVARVYVSCYTGEEDLREGLQGLISARGVLRRHLSQVLQWRFTPRLEFRPDRSWEYGQKMDALFRAVAEDDAARGQRADESSAPEDEEGDE